MASDNRNPQNAKPVGGRQPERNPPQQAGQATQDVGNAKGQKMAQQQGAKGTIDQAGTPMGAGQDVRGGPASGQRHWEGGRGLRQGTPETEETEE